MIRAEKIQSGKNLLFAMNSLFTSNKPQVLRFDGVCRMELAQRVNGLLHGKGISNRPLPVSTISIGESGFPFAHAPEYEFVTTNPHLKMRFIDASVLGAAHFKTSLEFAFNEFPYSDAFSVVCDVFKLALEIKKPSAISPSKRAGEVKLDM